MDIAEQVQQLRLVHRLEKDAERDLMDMETMQCRRWDLLRRVADYASDSYTAMRIDVVDERLRDQGATHWLGALLTVGVTLIPVSALTGGFIAGLTATTQKLLTSADRKLLQTAKTVYERELDPARVMVAAHKIVHLQDGIKRNEALIATVAKKGLEPELTSKLRNGRDALAKTLGNKQPLGKASAQKSIQNDVPVVQIKRSLDGWIETQILAEDIAGKKIRQQIRDLADIATSPNPRKEAKAKETEAMKEASEGPRLIGPPAPPAEEPLPKNNKAALDQLTELRKQLAPTSVESTSTPSSKALWDLQLAIESMIWATTYDFRPIREQIWKQKYREYDVVEIPRLRSVPVLVTQEAAAPLPESLWKRLIERYIDPADAKGKTFKEAGDSSNLAGQRPAKAQKWDPKFRLSYYFGTVLYPKIDEENGEMVRRFRGL